MGAWSPANLRGLSTPLRPYFLVHYFSILSNGIREMHGQHLTQRFLKQGCTLTLAGNDQVDLHFENVGDS